MLWLLMNLSRVCRQLIKAIADRARNLFLGGPDLLHRLRVIFAFPAGVCGDCAAIDCRRLPTNQTEGSAAINDHIKHAAQDVAVRKAAMAVLRKSGSIRHPAFEPKATKPTISKIEMNFINQPPF